MVYDDSEDPDRYLWVGDSWTTLERMELFGPLSVKSGEQHHSQMAPARIAQDVSTPYEDVRMHSFINLKRLIIKCDLQWASNYSIAVDPNTFCRIIVAAVTPGASMHTWVTASNTNIYRRVGDSNYDNQLTIKHVFFDRIYRYKHDDSKTPGPRFRKLNLNIDLRGWMMQYSSIDDVATHILNHEIQIYVLGGSDNTGATLPDKNSGFGLNFVRGQNHRIEMQFYD